MAKRATKTAAATSATTTVMVLVNNVWDSRTKWLKHDVVEVATDEADMMIANKQVKATKDDATHTVDAEGNRAEV